MNKVYETDSYAGHIRSKVLSCEPQGDRFRITLSDSIFFPEEGGQYADTGRLIPTGAESGSSDDLREIRLLQGEYHKNGAEPWISYLVDRFVEPGTTVDCELDWDIRYDRMQNHSGEHILSGLIHNTYGLNNVGFHLSDDGPVTLTMDGELTKEQVEKLEEEANRIICANLPITASFPKKEELSTLSYRSKIEIEGQVRLITIGEPDNPVDVCACCAPHVARTGEIGILKVLSVTRYKGGVQIGILCGRRAFLEFRHMQRLLTQTAAVLSTSADKLPALVAAKLSELSEAKGMVSACREKAYLDAIGNMPPEEPGCIFAEGDLSSANMKNIFNALTAHFSGYVGVFCGSDSEGYRYFAGSGHLDSTALASAMKEKLGAKGGGTKEMVQGKTMATRMNILTFFGNASKNANFESLTKQDM